MAQETLGTDANGKVDFSLPFAEKGAVTTLAANTEQTYQAPVGYNRVFFSYSVGSNVFAGIGSNALSIPGATFTASTAELCPGVRQLKGDGSELLRFISDTAAYVQLRFDKGGSR